MSPAVLDAWLDVLEVLAIANTDPFADADAWTDYLVLGRCSADGYRMILDPGVVRIGPVELGPIAWRPWDVAPGVPCPKADPQIGNCTVATFEPWKAAWAT